MFFLWLVGFITYLASDYLDQGSFNASLNLNNNNSVADLLMLSQNNSSSSPSINQQPLSSSIDSVIAKTDSVIAKTASAVDLRMDSNNNNSPFLPGETGLYNDLTNEKIMQR